MQLCIWIKVENGGCNNEEKKCLLIDQRTYRKFLICNYYFGWPPINAFEVISCDDSGFGDDVFLN